MRRTITLYSQDARRLVKIKMGKQSRFMFMGVMHHLAAWYLGAKEELAYPLAALVDVRARLGALEGQLMRAQRALDALFQTRGVDRASYRFDVALRFRHQSYQPLAHQVIDALIRYDCLAQDIERCYLSGGYLNHRAYFGAKHLHFEALLTFLTRTLQQPAYFPTKVSLTGVSANATTYEQASKTFGALNLSRLYHGLELPGIPWRDVARKQQLRAALHAKLITHQRGAPSPHSPQHSPQQPLKEKTL